VLTWTRPPQWIGWRGSKARTPAHRREGRRQCQILGRLARGLAAIAVLAAALAIVAFVRLLLHSRVRSGGMVRLIVDGRMRRLADGLRTRVRGGLG